MRISIVIVVAGLLAGAASMQTKAVGQTDAPRTTIEAGRAVFEARCAVCHGERADGQSKLAKVMRPRPPNLRTTGLDTEQMVRIVIEGGASVGRSQNMPAWAGELTAPEIAQVVGYLQSIRSKQ